MRISARSWAGRALAASLAALLGAHAHAQEQCPTDAPRLVVYHAGSLSAAFRSIERAYTEQTGVCVVDVAGGSIHAARRITSGGEACDIYASANYEDIDLLLKPARYADYTIRFAEGGMVLAYTTDSRNAATIAAAGVPFAPPASIPDAAPDWYRQITAPGVVIGGSHPFLDPGGYRADMIFQLVQAHYGVADLYDTLLTHYAINKPTDALGKTYDYQFAYEHGARAAARADATGKYRYVRLPPEVSLSDSRRAELYATRGTTIPSLQLADGPATVRMPARRVEWGLTILRKARNRDHAIAFLRFLFSREGAAIQAAAGPSPLSPPRVSRRDFPRLPGALKSIVAVAPDAAPAQRR